MADLSREQTLGFLRSWPAKIAHVSTVRGVDNLWITASTQRSRAYIFFKQGTDMDVAYREVRDRVQRARLRMPDDVERVLHAGVVRLRREREQVERVRVRPVELGGHRRPIESQVR